MKPQYQHQVMTSFLLWFDNYLLQEGQAYTNKTGRLFPFADSRLPEPFARYASPYKQWVTDSSVTGETNPIIPTAISVVGSSLPNINGVVSKEDGIYGFDFENGGIIHSGREEGIPSNSVITGTFAVKDFNIYLTNDTEEDLILERKFVNNSRYGDAESGIKPYDQAVPAIFINNEFVQNNPFAFGGEDETQMTIKAVVLAENEYQLDGALSIFADSTRLNVTLVPFTGYPITEYGDLKDGVFNYTGMIEAYKSSRPLYINDVTVSKLSDRAKKQVIGDLKVGFIDFDVHQHRFPRS